MTTRAKRKAPRSAWKPGQSGNPGGLPAAVREVRLLALERGFEAVERLTELMRQQKDPWLAKAAADSLLDRAGAKAYQAEPDRLEVIAHGDVRTFIIDRLAAFTHVTGSRAASLGDAAASAGSLGDGARGDAALAPPAGPADASAANRS